MRIIHSAWGRRCSNSWPGSLELAELSASLLTFWAKITSCSWSCSTLAGVVPQRITGRFVIWRSSCPILSKRRHSPRLRSHSEGCEMSETAKKFGGLVCVDGSAASHAAVAWGAREASMRGLPITLIHAIPPVIVGWPVGQLYAEMPEWQIDNARHAIDQARKTLRAGLGVSESPEILTEIVYS